MSFLGRDENKTVEGYIAYKKVTGVKLLIPANSTLEIKYIVPFQMAVIKGVKVINTKIGDSLNFHIRDTVNNDYSGIDPAGPEGPSVMLQHFGVDVYLDNGSLEDTADFAARLYQGMQVCCEYTNNNSEDRIIYMNVDIYELKDEE